jgi:OPA family sugar phosphate sensor protein UhpC-like MFS transporter
MQSLMMIFKTLLKPSPYIKPIQDSAQIDELYKYWRTRVFYSIYFGYVFFYLTRRSFASISNEIHLELGISFKMIGLCSTTFYICYGISKFISGMLSDNSNPRYFMSIGLIITGILNICFGMCSSLYMMAAIWGLNGIFQGWGWPPVAKQLTYWFSKRERGTWWSVCSTSHNVGGLLIPPIFAYLITYGVFGFIGWRFAMMVPGVLCIAGGLLLMNRLRDVPQSLGLPSIEKYIDPNSDIVERTTAARTIPFKRMFAQYILRNKFVWVMALSYFFVYVVRTAVNDWATIYLVDKGFARIAAGVAVSWFEIGGFIGTLAAGYTSDKWFKGNRITVSVLCALGMVVSLYAFGNINLSASDTILCNSIMSLMGFFVFGPQMLVGLAAAEYVDKKAAGTANGFVGFFGNVGAAVAGFPLGMTIDYSWNAFNLVLVACSAITFLILLPLCFNFSEKKLIKPRAATTSLSGI